AVDGRVDGALERRPEARPAGAALEFRVGRKQRRAAAGALERAGSLFAVEPARPRTLGAVLAEHVKLIGCQFALPVGVGVLHTYDCRLSAATILLRISSGTFIASSRPRR